MAKQPRSIWALPDRSLRKNRPRKQPQQAEMLPHYPGFLAYILASRYVTADHVHQRFQHKIKSLRTVQYQLARLVDLGYLKLVDVANTGPNFPHVYFATNQAVKYLRQTYKKELPEARQEAESLPSITHELFLTAFELSCYLTAKTRGDLSITLTERRYTGNRSLKITDKQWLKPDAGFHLAIKRPTPKPPAQIFYFAELDNGTEKLDIGKSNDVLTKFRKYTTWSTTQHCRGYLCPIYRKHGSPNPKPNYRLIIIARRQGERGRDIERMADIVGLALQLPLQMRNRMWFSTVDDLASHEHDRPPLQEKLWYRLADAETWVADYRSFLEHLPQQHRQLSQKRDYILERLPTLARHTLFPSPIT